jgi:glutaredoxin 2|tara:strand:- start:945 stop:1085 length:141 start_codon:yes stop_codon:yes gene_type:complete
MRIIKKELLELAGFPQVPCLKIDDNYMHESLDIIEKLKNIFLKKTD